MIVGAGASYCYRVNEFVADETAIHLSADQLESASQIIGRLAVIVLDLM